APNSWSSGYECHGSSSTCTPCFDFCLDLSSSPLYRPFLTFLSSCIQRLLFECLLYILEAKRLINQNMIKKQSMLQEGSNQQSKKEPVQCVRWLKSQVG
ncbi:mCG142514, isoform CRA_a, partial [Mus musculus]